MTKAGANASAIAIAEEEEKPQREMILLDYTEEELKQLNDFATTFNSTIQDDDDGEILDPTLSTSASTKMKKKDKKLTDLQSIISAAANVINSGNNAGVSGNVGVSAIAIPSSIQQKVLEQARNIAAQLHKKADTTATNAGDASASGGAVSKEDQKVLLKQLVDKIPTDRYVPS